MCARFFLHFCLVVALGLSAVACATTQLDNGEPKPVSQNEIGRNPADPWEGWNRKTYAFNDWLDRNILLPVAKGYVAVTPSGVRKSVGNFFSNLTEPISLVNNLIQGDIEGAGTSFFRFTTNTVFGLFGIFDVATEIGIRKDREDFGQTLGALGVVQGDYLVLPFLGPSTTRDMLSFTDMFYYNKYAWTENDAQRYSAFLLNAINSRAEVIDLEGIIIGDRYTFIRDAYLQRRRFLVSDGKVTAKDSFGQDADLSDDGDFDNLDDEF